MTYLRLLMAMLPPIVALGCGGGSSDSGQGSDPVEAPPVTPGNWAVLGSSSAAGTGAMTGQGWAARLQAAVTAQGVTITNVAYSGTTTWQALPTGTVPPADRPDPDEAHNITRALAVSPKLVLLSFPSNDTAQGYSAAETVANIRTLRATATAAGAATLVLGVQPRNLLSSTQRATLAEVERQLTSLAGACHVSLYPALADADGNIATAYAYGDGIHLNDAGHAVVLAQVQAVLNAARCVRLSSTD